MRLALKFIMQKDGGYMDVILLSIQSDRKCFCGFLTILRNIMAQPSAVRLWNTEVSTQEWTPLLNDWNILCRNRPHVILKTYIRYHTRVYATNFKRCFVGIRHAASHISLK
jgi:hypothetical protein